MRVVDQHFLWTHSSFTPSFHTQTSQANHTHTQSRHKQIYMAQVSQCFACVFIVQPRMQLLWRSQPYSDDFLNGVRYDYASMHAGARLVTHAKGLLHAKAVLSPDKSLYMLSPCETRSWFVISLLEDIFVEYVGLVTLELFASGYRHLQILGSNQYPTEVWRLLGEIESNATSNYELFDVGSRCQRLAEECWVRFLKIRVLSHHRMEDNSFCALTRFQVFGATATNYIAKERTAEDRRDRRVDPSLLDIARWHED